MRSPLFRAALALVLFSGWLALLFSGFAFHGGVHLLLAAGLGLFPWRAAGAPSAPERLAPDRLAPERLDRVGQHADP